MYQISFYVPKESLEKVKNAMFVTGAGNFNNYQNCCWQTIGTGQFKPINNAKPAIGNLNKIEKITEYKVEMMCDEKNIKKVIKAMKDSHPYEEIAFSIIKMEDL
jgi:hypothetical protein